MDAPRNVNRELETAHRLIRAVHKHSANNRQNKRYSYEEYLKRKEPNQQA